jgi:hypothetical protein
MIHLLTASFPTSYRPKNSDKDCRKSIFSVWLLIGSDTQKSRVKAPIELSARTEKANRAKVGADVFPAGSSAVCDGRTGI